MKRTNRNNSGFTLIEILMAFAIFASIGGLMIGLLISGIESREKTVNLSRAVRLASQKMDSIKGKRREDSGNGKYRSFPGFSYKYEIKQIELDLAKMLSGETAPEEGSEEGDQPDVGKYLKEFGLSKETVTGAVFKMLRYEVIIEYGKNQNYTLVFYRGLGVF